MNENDRERDQRERAYAVYRQIEELTEALAQKRAVLRWLRGGIVIKEVQIRDLENRIQTLHEQRNAIFHEDKE